MNRIDEDKIIYQEKHRHLKDTDNEYVKLIEKEKELKKHIEDTQKELDDVQDKLHQKYNSISVSVNYVCGIVDNNSTKKYK